MFKTWLTLQWIKSCTTASKHGSTSPTRYIQPTVQGTWSRRTNEPLHASTAPASPLTKAGHVQDHGHVQDLGGPGAVPGAVPEVGPEVVEAAGLQNAGAISEVKWGTSTRVTYIALQDVSVQRLPPLLKNLVRGG